MLMDVHQHADLRFPQSLPEFQRLFPNDAACAAYLEKARWDGGFVCGHCQATGEPFRFANRPGVLRCRKCRRDTALTAGTVMRLSHTPLSIWFWALSSRTAARRHSAASLSVPLYQGHLSLPTTGAATPASPSVDTNTWPSLNGAIRRWPNSICQLSISSLPI